MEKLRKAFSLIKAVYHGIPVETNGVQLAMDERYNIGAKVTIREEEMVADMGLTLADIVEIADAIPEDEMVRIQGSVVLNEMRKER